MLQTSKTVTRQIAIYHSSLTARITELKRIAEAATVESSSACKRNLSVFLPDIATTEYCCHVHDIFNCILMNKSKRVTLSRFPAIKEFLKYRLQYFGRMQSEQVIRHKELSQQKALQLGDKSRVPQLPELQALVFTHSGESSEVQQVPCQSDGKEVPQLNDKKKKRNKANDDPAKAWTTKFLDIW
jgi:hypothetical protein